MALFNRVVELTVGPEGGQGIQITGLRVTFKIKKTEKRETNSAVVEVYNISPTNRTQIIDLDNLMVLKAGYVGQGGAETLFVGNLTNINHVRQGADIVTKLEVNDGEKAIRETNVKLTYAAGTLAKQVLDDLVAKFPLATYYMDQAIAPDAEFKNGFAFTGQFATAMDKLGAKLGFSWSVQDGELQVLKTGNANKEPAVYLSKATGMIGTPERLQDKGKATLVIDQNKPGWRVSSLLMPKIKVGGRILITSPQIEQKTPFHVVNVEHTGDTHGNDWTTQTEVSEGV